MATNEYNKREKRIMDELNIKDPYEVHLAVERAYTGKKLTEKDKKILQVGWPELHGKLGEKFKYLKENPSKFAENFYDKGILKAKKKLGVRDYQVRRTIGNILKNRKLDDLEKQILQAGWPRLFGESGSKIKIPARFYIFATLDPDFAGRKLTKNNRVEIAKKITGATEDRIYDVLSSAKKGNLLSEWEQEILDAGWHDIKDKFSEAYLEVLNFSKDEFEKIKNDINIPTIDIFSTGRSFRTRFAAIKDILDVESSEIRTAILKLLENRSLDPKDKRILQVGWPEHFGLQFGSFHMPEKFYIIRDLTPKYQGKEIDDSDRQDIAIEITGAEIDEILVAIQKASGGEKLSKKDQEIIKAGWPDVY